MEKVIDTKLIVREKVFTDKDTKESRVYQVYFIIVDGKEFAVKPSYEPDKSLFAYLVAQAK